MRNLPAGTVTFLFTDIEGSTRLLAELGADLYAGRLADHRDLVRNACYAHGGVEIDTQGDAFFIAFGDARDALAAARQAQDALSTGTITVRMGLHTGEPVVTAEGYVGMDVHTGARIGASAHGGQIVCSRRTKELGGDGFDFMDLGEHRLKDLREPIWIYKLGHGRFPPLKTLSNTNLPTPASSFVGRAGELEEAAGLLERTRLLNIVGPGGAGKTRFAIELASRALDRFPNGVFWVGLAAVRDPALVLDAAAQTVGANDGLAEHIGERKMLLLFDNLEHVMAAAPDLSRALEACPNLTMLVTSRELMRTRGERSFPLPPLNTDEGVSLFCERAGTEASEAVAEICRRLDGLPLAIELAAARTALLSPEQILARIGERLDLLEGGRDADPRQQTLRATIRWSHDLLTDGERRLFARLGVFVDGCTLDAAEWIAEAQINTLQSLVEKSMVQRTDERFWMFESIREFALERLEEDPTANDIRRRHAEHYTALAEVTDEALESEQHLVLDKDWGNLRAALEWSCGGGDGAIALRLAGGLWRFWWNRGGAREGEAWCAAALAAGADQPEELRARAVYCAANMAMARNDPETALVSLEQALSVFRRSGDSLRVMRTLNDLGIVAQMREDFRGARLFQEESLAMAEAANDVRSAAVVRVNLAELAVYENRPDDATKLLHDVVSTMRALGEREIRSTALSNLAAVEFKRGDPEKAATFLGESIVHTRETKDWRQLGHSLAVAAAVIAARGDATAATHALAGAASLCEDSGIVLEANERQIYEQTHEKLRIASGRAGFDVAWAEGKSRAFDAVIDYTLAALEKRDPPSL